jgi:hypothetical protein
VPRQQQRRPGPLIRRDGGQGLIELAADPGRPGAWTLLVDGTPQSHVDLTDPRHLEFEYMRWLGHLADLAAPPGEPLRVLHLGAGALTLARYVAATRPASRQLAVDTDAVLIELVRQRLPLGTPPRPAAGRRDGPHRVFTRRESCHHEAGPRGSRRPGRIRIRAGDARAVLGELAAGSFDMVVADLFTAGRTPPHVTTAEFTTAAARVLAPEGVFAANIGDGPPLAFARAQVATVRSVFPHACLLAEAGVLRARRFGNLVLAGSRRKLPAAELARRAAACPFPARLLHAGELARFAAGARPVTDAVAQPSPAPPADLLAGRPGGAGR